MNKVHRAAVRERAANRCEYCQRRQAESPLVPLQVEHIVPRQHGGNDDLENLALACADCNLHKGPNLTGIDPDTKQVTQLFNPRVDTWDDHFLWDGIRILGQTPIGRTTIRVLELNAPVRLRIRLAGRPG